MAATISSPWSLRSIRLMLLTALTYFVLARVSLLLAIGDSNATPVWPPSGWALAAVLLLGRRVAPGIWLGAAAVNTVVFLANGVEWPTAGGLSALIGVGNTAEALAGYYLLRWVLLPGVAVDHYFRRVQHVLRFLLAAVLMCFISSTPGTLVIDAAGILPPGQLMTIWFTWWSGDVTGVLLFAPLLLAWATRAGPYVASRKKVAEGALLFSGLILVTGTVFNNWLHPSFLAARSFWVVPFLMWAAARFHPRVLVVALMLSALLALYGTLHGTGPFAAPDLNDGLLATQAFIAVNGVMALLLQAALYEREQIARSLREGRRNLERLVAERTAALDHQKLQVEHLLRNILPAEVVKELQTSGKALPRSYEQVSVLFTDFKGFSLLAEKMTAEEVVEELSTCFRGFDSIVEKYRLEKIKTMGDSYMCAGGIPVPDADHPFRIIQAGLEMLAFMKDHNQGRADRGLEPLEVRIGVHVGPVVAGVLGTRKYAYDIWGNTVNIASRMESSGAPGEVNISAATYELIKERYACRYRGKVNAKNVGEVDMYFVQGELGTILPSRTSPEAVPRGAVAEREL